MVTGIEAAGLALAIFPILVNQLDACIRGIEKIKVLRNYRREFKDFCQMLKTQHAILLNNLEDVLEGIVEDEYELSELISNPRGNSWEDPNLQKQLRIKLGRNYDVFVVNTIGLSELLERLSIKLETSTDSAMSLTTKARQFFEFRKVLTRAVYDDLFAKVDKTNTILKTLTEQSRHQEKTRRRRQPYRRLLQRYRKARKHAEGLFRTITDGGFWRCRCKEHHCVHLQLQTNPGENAAELSDPDSPFKFRMIFSNDCKEDMVALWGWIDAIAEPCEVEQVTPIANLSLRENPPPPTGRTHNPRVRFDMPVENHRPLDTMQGLPPARRISDLCSSLRVAETHIGELETIGSVSNECDPSMRYTMYAAKRVQNSVHKRSLREVLSQLSRHDRLHIAAGLARGVMHFHGNWLKSHWNSSDVHIAVDNDVSGALLDNLYISWPLSNPSTAAELTMPSSALGNLNVNTLLPLGVILVELSLGKPLDQNEEITNVNTVARLVKMVFDQSGMRYAEAVNICLSGFSISSLCHENLKKPLEEFVFDAVFSPILNDLNTY